MIRKPAAADFQERPGVESARMLSGVVVEDSRLARKAIGRSWRFMMICAALPFVTLPLISVGRDGLGGWLFGDGLALVGGLAFLYFGVVQREWVLRRAGLSAKRDRLDALEDVAAARADLLADRGPQR